MRIKNVKVVCSMDGCQTVRRWDSVIQALVDAGEIHLRPNETIKEISVDEFGLKVKYSQIK